MKHNDKKDSQDAELNRLDRMLDEPVPNKRYGGMPMREMVRKVVIRRVDRADDSISESNESGRK